MRRAARGALRRPDRPPRARPAALEPQRTLAALLRSAAGAWWTAADADHGPRRRTLRSADARRRSTRRPTARSPEPRRPHGGDRRRGRLGTAPRPAQRGAPASGRHGGAVNGARFTPDGRWLVTTATTATRSSGTSAQAAGGDACPGHGAGSRRADRARRQDPLHASLDGTVLVWDLVGQPRLGRPFDGRRVTGRRSLSSDGRLIATRAGRRRDQHRRSAEPAGAGPSRSRTVRGRRGHRLRPRQPPADRGRPYAWSRCRRRPRARRAPSGARPGDHRHGRVHSTRRASAPTGAWSPRPAPRATLASLCGRCRTGVPSAALRCASPHGGPTRSSARTAACCRPLPIAVLVRGRVEIWDVRGAGASRALRRAGAVVRASAPTAGARGQEPRRRDARLDRQRGSR